MADGSNLVVLLGLKAREKRLRFLGYDKLKDRRYEVWDLSALSDDFRNEVSYPDEVHSGSALILIDTWDDLQRRFSRYADRSPYYLLTRVHDDWARDRLFQLICRYNGRLVYKHERVHPHQAPTSFVDKVRGRFGYVRQLLSDVVRGAHDIYPSDVFIPTRPHIRHIRHAGFRTSIHPIHTVDYDKYLEGRSVPANEFGSEPYAVFLDQNLPHHAELRDRYGDNWIDPGAYYDAAQSFFQRFLDAAPVNVSTVKVAAHPNTDIDVSRRYWGDVEVIQGRTSALVHHSQCVLAQFSLAAFFAAMADTPICFFTTPALRETDLHDHIEEMAAIFHRRVNSSTRASLGDSVNAGCDPDVYRSIRKRYVKAPGTPDVNSCIYMYETLVG